MSAKPAPSRQKSEKRDARRPKRVADAPRAYRRRAKPIAAKDEGERRGRQVIRQVMILSALSAAARGLSAQELLQVAGDGTIRTLYRDLDHLQAAGFALGNEDGRWLVEPKSRLSVPLQPEEVLALMVATQAAGAEGPFALPLQTLRKKLLATMTPAARAYCEELSDTTLATTLGNPAVHPAIAAAVRDAIEKEQRLAITYAKPGHAPARRIVEPYATWIADGRPYLVARCPEKAEPQTFHLARLSSAEVLDETFEKDPSFSLAEYARQGFGAFHGPVHDVVLELDPEVAHVARENEYHPTQRIEELEAGGVRLRMQTGGLPRLARWIAGFGGKVRVVEPEDLAEIVREIATGALRSHPG